MRFTLALFSGLILIYLALCALLYFQQRSMLYFPQFTKVDAATTNFTLKRNDITLRGWVDTPGKAKAILYFGGNGERIENTRIDITPWLPDYTIYLLAYRGYGASDGVPTQADIVGDVTALYDSIATKHSAVSVIGRSLGTGVAMQLAARRKLEKIALITPFDSIDRVAGHHYPFMPTGLLTVDKFESWKVAQALKSPVLILQAGNDEVIPATNTENLIRQFVNPPRHITIAGADHNSLDQHTEYRTELAAFFK